MQIMHDVYLLLGSNLGDRETWLSQARDLIEVRIGPIIQASALYETASWGNTDQPSYINQVVLIQSGKQPRLILDTALDIEKILGRERIAKWGSRTIDIDILLFGDKVLCEEGLTIPHPHMHERRFVLEPLKEIAPDLQHPILKKTITYLYNSLTDVLSVKQIKN